MQDWNQYWQKYYQKVSTIDFLFVIVTPEFCEVLPFSFKVTVDLIPSQVFLKFVEYFWK